MRADGLAAGATIFQPPALRHSLPQKLRRMFLVNTQELHSALAVRQMPTWAVLFPVNVTHSCLFPPFSLRRNVNYLILFRKIQRFSQGIVFLCWVPTSTAVRMHIFSFTYIFFWDRHSHIHRCTCLHNTCTHTRSHTTVITGFLSSLPFAENFLNNKKIRIKKENKPDSTYKVESFVLFLRISPGISVSPRPLRFLWEKESVTCAIHNVLCGHSNGSWMCITIAEGPFWKSNTL